jgi:predicted transcriptional regulator
MSSARPQPVAVKLDPALKERIRKLADARQRTSHWMMREAISQYVEREEKRESFQRDALEAWKEFEATGLHVKAAEADGWLERLERGEILPPPAPVR